MGRFHIPPGFFLATLFSTLPCIGCRRCVTFRRGAMFPVSPEKERALAASRRARHPRGRSRRALRALGRQGRPEREQGRHLRRAAAPAKRHRRQVSGGAHAGDESLPRPPAPRRRDRGPPARRGQRARAGDRAHPAAEAPSLAARARRRCLQQSTRRRRRRPCAGAPARGGLIVHRRLRARVAPAARRLCAAPPPTLQGRIRRSPSGAGAGPGRTGERVRWGGEIASTTPQNGETCFEVVSKPLDRPARPIADGRQRRPLRRCAPGFDDPAIYAPGREVTVVGSARAARRAAKVGDADYSFAEGAGRDGLPVAEAGRRATLGTTRTATGLRLSRLGLGSGWGWGGWGWGGRGGGFIGRTVRSAARHPAGTPPVASRQPRAREAPVGHVERAAVGVGDDRRLRVHARQDEVHEELRRRHLALVEVVLLALVVLDRARASSRR